MLLSMYVHKSPCSVIFMHCCSVDYVCGLSYYIECQLHTDPFNRKHCGHESECLPPLSPLYNGLDNNYRAFGDNTV